MEENTEGGRAGFDRCRGGEKERRKRKVGGGGGKKKKRPKIKGLLGGKRVVGNAQWREKNKKKPERRGGGDL